MSQSRIKLRSGAGPMGSALMGTDWLTELESDAAKFQAVMATVDQNAAMAIADLGRHDYSAVAERLLHIREGLKLACEVVGINLRV